MKKWLYRTTEAILFCCLAAALPVLAQDNHPQTNEHATHAKQTQKTEHRAQKPAANTRQTEHNANRAQPQRQNARPAQRNTHARAQQNRSARPAQRRPNSGRRPAQWGRPPVHRGTYRFRANDRSALHRYYLSRLRGINRANRPIFRVGGYFPYAYIGYLSPLPPSLYGMMPPPPFGYQMGYYDGYVVVYDPATYFIASVIDLMQ
ncbi:MAG: hypothetical protein WAM66_12415 [Acidobacteriaceae bacterium]